MEKNLPTGTPRINLIVAMAHQRAIGARNTLPWRLPEDLQYFKRTTLGHPIIMGRNTFESIGKPLPGRRNIVVSRQPDYAADGCEVAHSLADAIRLCAAQPEVFVIGGAQLYAQALPLSDRLYVTEIDLAVEADTFFPPFEHMGWQEVQRESLHAASPNDFDFAFVVYDKAG
ncbi:MAG: dihydrofolate reductase [Burkholderiaceae bacterium]|nr:MAG: dihydrofolate reductase [Burkholderiaceae bacterium]